MGRALVQESQLRKHIRAWPETEAGYVTFIEPAVGAGADVGVSDCLITVRGQMRPVELKRGDSVVKELRPSQRRWHRLNLHSGLQTYGLTLRNDGQVVMFAIGLAGGLMSELIERKIMRCSLEELNYNAVSYVITSYSLGR